MFQTDEKGQKYLPLTLITLIILAIFAFALYLRLYELQRMAYHHDESIHAYYSWRLFAFGRSEYRYDPVYHGPFLYHWGAFFFLLFGDTDYTARLPYVAIGMFLLYLIYKTEGFISKRAMLWMLFFAAISPSLTYFSRFARHDVYSGGFSYGILLFTMFYLKTLQPKYLYLTALNLILLYSSKEDSYMVGFVFCSFISFWALLRVLFAKDRKEAWADIFSTYSQLTKIVIVYGIFSVFTVIYDKIYVIRDSKPSLAGLLDPAKWKMFSRGYWLLGGIVTVIVFLCLWYLKRILKQYDKRIKEYEIYKEHHPIIKTLIENRVFVISIVVIVAVYIFLFTTMFFNRTGLKTGIVDYLTYWMKNQAKPRIPGPHWYYIPRLALYEFIMFLLAVVGSIYYLVRGLLFLICQIQSGLKEESATKNFKVTPLSILSVYWFIWSLIFFAWAQEKVPWLLYHQVVPMILVASLFLDDMLNFLVNRKIIRRIALTIVIVLSVFSIRQNILLNFYNNDDPREIMVYTQSHQHVLGMVKEIEEIAFRLGTHEQTRISCDGDGQWPLSWYLRHYAMVPGAITNTDSPILISDWTKRTRMEQLLEGKYHGRKYILRAWWTPPYDFLKNEWKNSPSSAVKKLWDYIIYRKTWTTTGSTDVMFYVKKDIMPGYRTGKTEEETAQAESAEKKPDDTEILIPSGYKEPIRAGNFVRTWGKKGVGDGQFDEPRDIACDSEGNVYVVDSKNDRIQKFDSEGNFILKFGSEGKEEGKFADPCGITIDKEDNLYVVDTWNHRVQKFDKNGRFIKSWANQFYGPRAIASDSQSNIYVVDTGNKRIQVFTKNGDYINEWGFKGDSPGKFEEPVGIALDPQDNVYVADTANQRVQVFTKSGEFLRQWKVLGWENFYTEPYLEYHPDGYLYATDSSTSNVHTFDLMGKTVVLWGFQGSGRGEFNGCVGAGIDKDGNVYVSDTQNHRIEKFKAIK